MSFNTKASDGNFVSMNSIPLDEALRVMEMVDEDGKPVPFAITVPTCDLNRNRGGELLTYKQAVLCNPGPSDKKAYHFRNNVRNIKGLGSNEPRGIHPILIIELNGRSITL